MCTHAYVYAFRIDSMYMQTLSFAFHVERIPLLIEAQGQKS